MESEYKTHQGQNSLLKPSCQLIQGKDKEKDQIETGIYKPPTVPEDLLDSFLHAFPTCQFLSVLH